MALLNLSDVNKHTPPIIIAHEGYAHDFPILASFIKHNYNDYTVLAELMYVDVCWIVAIGDPDWTLYVQISRSRRGHSALDDAKIRKTICPMSAL